MAKPTLYWFDDNFLPLSSFNYAVLLAGYPDLGPLVTSMEIPARSTGRVRVELMGKSRVWPGRRLSSTNEIVLTVLLNRKTNTYQQLVAIQDSFSEAKTGNMVGKPFSIRAIHYDDVGVEAMVVDFSDCWLAEVASYQLDSTGEGEIISVQCTFCYSNANYAFTGMAGVESSTRTTIHSRLGEPILVSDMDGFGAFSPMSVNKNLAGFDPTIAIDKLRASLTKFTGLSLSELGTLGKAINTVRAVSTSTSSKLNALSSLRSNITSGNVTGAVSKVRSLMGGL